MQKNLFLLVLLFHITVFFSQTVTDNYLVVNPGGHKGQIRKLLVTNDRKKIVTASMDKSIKIWDIESGELEREILGQIGKGSEGSVYDIAISPNNKILAVGGFFGNDDGLVENVGNIRLYNFETGKIIKVLKAHINVIQSLKFVDNNMLLSADAESTLFLWNINTSSIIRKYNHHDKTVDAINDEVKSITVYGNYFVTGDNYGRIKLWDVNNPDTIKCDKYYETIQADGVSYSNDGKFIIAVADTFFTIFDKNLTVIADGTNEVAPEFCAVSPDNNKIIFGSLSMGKEYKANILIKKDSVWENYGTFTEFDNTILTGAFIDNETFALAGGSRDAIYIVKLIGQNKKPQLLKILKGSGKEKLAAALTDNYILFADEWTDNFGLSKFNNQFDLVSKKLESPSYSLIGNRPQVSRGNYTLRRARKNDVLNGSLILEKNGKLIDSINVEYWNGSRHNVFGFLNDNYFVTGNASGLFSVYNLNCIEVSRFVGHTGDIWGFSISKDGKNLISTSADKTIKIWPLSKIDTPNPEFKMTVEELCKKNNIYDERWKKIFKKLKIEKETKSTKLEDWKIVVDKINEKGYPTVLFSQNYNELKVNSIYPTATIFTTEQGDWIIWNEDGYFTSSKKAARFVGYHVNQGKEKEAKYYPFEQFDLKFNRPDIIMKDLGLASVEMIKAYEYAYQKRLKKMGIKEEQLSTDIHLPEMAVVSHSFNEQTEKLTIKLSASDSKYKLNRITIFVDDVPVFGSAGIDISKNATNTYSGEVTVDLIPGKNKIQLSVLNEVGTESLKETFSVIDNKKQKPDLYIVSIGVSKYKDASFNLNYAAKDASDMALFFVKSELYNKVNVSELTNEKVTKENILKLKTDFLAQAKANDIVLFFVAGHGVLNTNMDFYYGAYNMDFQHPENGGITYEELESMLDGIKPYRKLFFMDTCHSGELDKDDYVATTNVASSEEKNDVVFRNAGDVGVEVKKGIGLSQSSQLIQELFSDLRRGSGATVISSAGGAEFAMESKDWKNGLFTYCLLTGMKNKEADLNNDGMIMLSEIQNYVQKEVTKLSKGKQLPTSRRENLEFDYRIW